MAHDKSGADSAENETKIPRDALDDDVFAQLMEEEFAKEKTKDKSQATGADDASGDAGMQARVWQKLQKQIAETPTTLKPLAQSQSVARGQPVARTRTTWPIVAGVLGLAAAVLFFLRVGPAQDAGESDALNPSNLKGAIESARSSLEVTRDAATGSPTFSVRGGDASVGYGAVFFASNEGEAKLVASGTFAPAGTTSELRPLQVDTKEGFSNLPEGQQGRVCLFTSSTLEGLNSIISVAPKVFLQQAPEMCQDVPTSAPAR